MGGGKSSAGKSSVLYSTYITEKTTRHGKYQEYWECLKTAVRVNLNRARSTLRKELKNSE